MFLIELKSSKSPETKNYLGIKFRLALKNSCQKRSFFSHVLWKMPHYCKSHKTFLSKVVVLILLINNSYWLKIVFKVSEKKFFKWYLCCDTDIIQFSFGCRFWWYIFLNGIVTKSGEKRKRRYKFGYFY